ncbi:MAG TPA: DinB family protein [Candidatus Acidoferrum sp.]|nr:DinB family protein [Candidatus Acidoferrum sp.]
MTKDDIQLLFEYDRWANNRIFHAASSLGTEEFTRDLGGSFHSVRDTLVHIIGGEWGWLTIWKEPSLSSAFVTDLWTRLDARFPPDAFPDVGAVQLKWAEVEREQAEFVNRVTNESLRRMLPIRETQISLAHLMQHLANHSTYHRGQVSLMMRQLAAEPLATDFALFLMEGRPEPRVPIYET